jgi:molecular chaperone DnaK (HSP70)
VAYNLGVDLGTTSIAAALHEESGARMTALGDRSVVEPAAAYLREDGTLITGRHAASRTVSSPARVARGLLRLLGGPDPVYLGGQPFTVPDLLTRMLRAVLERVIEMQGGPPGQVVLSHPASWGSFQRLLFEQVGVQAGTLHPVLVTAPEAAAAYYARSGRPGHTRPVAVYDMGGGTFDVAATLADRNGSRILGAPQGDQHLGGIDVDEALMRHVDHRAGGELSALDPRDPDTATAVARLRQDCTRAKELLSVESEVLVPVIVGERHFDVPVTRPELEELIRGRIEFTAGSLTKALGSAGVRPDELGAVLLLGGSSRMPLVAPTVSEALGRAVRVDDQLTFAVALGAAVLAGPPAVAAPAPPAGEPGAARRAVGRAGRPRRPPRRDAQG